jgi:Ca2+:H+ antiporter
MHSPALVIPAAYHASKSGTAQPLANGTMPIFDSEPPNPNDGSLSGLLIISRGTAILLLFIYVAYLFFQLKTHGELFVAEGQAKETEEPKMNAVTAGASCVS